MNMLIIPPTSGMWGWQTTRRWGEALDERIVEKCRGPEGVAS